MKCKLIILLFATTIFSYNHAQTLKPKTYTQWVSKSADYIESNKLDSAEYALNQALINDPDNKNNTWILTSLSTIQQSLGKYDAAYISVTAALNQLPKSVFILHQRANLYREMERWDDAKEDYNAILAIDSIDVEALYHRGVLNLEAKNKVAAEKDFEMAERHGEFSPYGLLGKALLYRLDENWEEAEKIYTLLLKNDPSMKELYIKRAECYLNLDQQSRLAADLMAAASTEFDNPMYYFLRGQLRLKQFDKLEARNDFKRARDLGMDQERLSPWLKKTN